MNGTSKFFSFPLFLVGEVGEGRFRSCFNGIGHWSSGLAQVLYLAPRVHLRYIYYVCVYTDISTFLFAINQQEIDEWNKDGSLRLYTEKEDIAETWLAAIERNSLERSKIRSVLEEISRSTPISPSCLLKSLKIKDFSQDEQTKLLAFRRA